VGSAAQTPRFIETLPRRGYRFIQPVKSVAPHVVAQPKARHYAWQAAALTLALLIVGLFAFNAFGLRDRFLNSGNGPASIALAVLPLKNLSGDPNHDYYADGISEALITELGKIARLQVLSFHTVSQYRQTQKRLPEIARELRVDALLEGSVVRSGDRVRITAKLFQAAPERQIFSESYEFEARDVLTVQAEVARGVVARSMTNQSPPRTLGWPVSARSGQVGARLFPGPAIVALASRHPAGVGDPSNRPIRRRISAKSACDTATSANSGIGAGASAADRGIWKIL
jgi:TolB-like protein